MKTLYALNYLFEGNDDFNSPYSTTIAVSENKDTLIKEMKQCIQEDCTFADEDDEDEWDININYEIFNNYGDEVILRHRKYDYLYARYKIHQVLFK